MTKLRGTAETGEEGTLEKEAHQEEEATAEAGQEEAMDMEEAGALEGIRAGEADGAKRSISFFSFALMMLSLKT